MPPSAQTTPNTPATPDAPSSSRRLQEAKQEATPGFELAVLLPHHSHLTARSLRAHKQAVVCLPTAHYTEAASRIYPREERYLLRFPPHTDHLNATATALLGGQCDAAILWMPNAELMHLQPCSTDAGRMHSPGYCGSVSRGAFQHFIFQDPMRHRVRVETTTTEEVEAVRVEYPKVAAKVCQRLLKVGPGVPKLPFC